MSQWNLIIDVARCENCHNCVIANKDEFVGNEFPGYSAPHSLQSPSTIRIERKIRGSGHHVDTAYLPMLCNHCDDAPCIKDGAGAVTKRPDGIVVIDPIKAKGKKELVQSCPYGAIVFNQEQDVPQQWIFDAHLLDQGWTEPRCSHSCPTAAIRALKLEDSQMAEMVRDENLKVLQPQLGTRPRVYYRNLHRYLDCFIAGSVVTGTQGKLECAQGALVQLLLEGKVAQEKLTDAFGDFKFDGLSAQSGLWQIHIVYQKIDAIFAQTHLSGESVVLEPIVLDM